MRTAWFPLLLSFLLIIAQTTLAGLLTIGTAVPDILVIWLVYLAVVRGQLTATVAGFFIGLFVDLISGQDGVLGLSSLTKSLAGFMAGYFYNQNKIEQNLSSWRFVTATGLASALHNAIYFLILLQGTSIEWWRAIAVYGIPSTLYTLALAAIPMFVFRRKYEA